MKAMQLKYAVERAESIYHSKLKSARENNTTPGVELDDEQIFTALRRGEFSVRKKLKNASPYYRHTAIREYIEFAGERAEKVNKVALEKELDTLAVAHRRILDELHLGDAEEALRLLESYAAGATN